LVAPHGQEALRLCEAHPNKISLLLTDVIMPGMNGSQLAQEVKKRIPEISVLFMSGYPGDILKHHQLSGPHIGFIEKSHVAGNLAYRVRALLDAITA
jgi:two-component system, cell cycle sensor histidine kinase and response regulator CckA